MVVRVGNNNFSVIRGHDVESVYEAYKIENDGLKSGTAQDTTWEYQNPQKTKET